jgi:hypothetical protein
MTEGRLTLRRFNGIEIVRLQTAEIMAYRSDGHMDGHIFLSFEIRTEKEAEESPEDTVGWKNPRSAEVNVLLSELAPSSLVGKHFSVPEGWTEEWDLLARLYYFSHEPVNNNEIDVLEQQGNQFRIRWTGTTQDINFYDGSKPETILEVEGWFIFTDMEKWEPEVALPSAG